jgi:hypothetical protein
VLKALLMETAAALIPSCRQQQQQQDLSLQLQRTEASCGNSTSYNSRTQEHQEQYKHAGAAAAANRKQHQQDRDATFYAELKGQHVGQYSNSSTCTLCCQAIGQPSQLLLHVHKPCSAGRCTCLQSGMAALIVVCCSSMTLYMIHSSLWCCWFSNANLGLCQQNFPGAVSVCCEVCWATVTSHVPFNTFGCAC